MISITRWCLWDRNLLLGAIQRNGVKLVSRKIFWSSAFLLFEMHGLNRVTFPPNRTGESNDSAPLSVKDRPFPILFLNFSLQRVTELPPWQLSMEIPISEAQYQSEQYGAQHYLKSALSLRIAPSPIRTLRNIGRIIRESITSSNAPSLVLR